MKFGPRKPSLKKSVKARTTGRLKRNIKSSVNPIYGKKGIGFIKNPEKSTKNYIYHRTTFDTLESVKKSPKSKKPIGIFIAILLFLFFLIGTFSKPQTNSQTNKSEVTLSKETNTIAVTSSVSTTVSSAPEITPTTSSTPSPDSTNTLVPSPTTTIAPTNKVSEENENKTISSSYVLNKNTKKFHHPYCSSVSQMKDSNKIEFKGTRDEVISKGYSPCKKCNP